MHMLLLTIETHLFFNCVVQSCCIRVCVEGSLDVRRQSSFPSAVFSFIGGAIVMGQLPQDNYTKYCDQCDLLFEITQCYNYKGVKWTAPDPCLVLSESGSILCTNFEFCEEKNHRHLKNILIYKAKQFIMTKTNP